MANSDDWQVYQQYLSEPPDDTDVFGIKQHKPKYPQYSVESKRFESFKLSPDVLREKSTNLAEAGLVYTGHGDSVRCFDCGDELRDWTRDDDPWKEHARLNPNCQHVLRVKGRQYIDRVKRGEKPEDGSKSEVVEAPSSQKDLIDTPAAQACLQMGYKTPHVLGAFDRYNQRSGNLSPKAIDIAAILEDMSEEQRPFEEAVSVNESTENRCENDNERPIYFKTMIKPDGEVVCFPCGHRICSERCTTLMSNCPKCKASLSGGTVTNHE